MLVLARRKNERVMIGPDIILTVVEIRHDSVRLGIAAPPDVVVDREEIAMLRCGPGWTERE